MVDNKINLFPRTKNGGEKRRSLLSAEKNRMGKMRQISRGQSTKELKAADVLHTSEVRKR